MKNRKNRTREAVSDGLTAAGFCCVTVGAALWHPVAGFLAAGASLLLMGLLIWLGGGDGT